MGIAETIDIFLEELANCSPEQIAFIDEIVNWDDETKSAFKALCHNFRESTIILTRFQEVIMIVETSYAQTIEE